MDCSYRNSLGIPGKGFHRHLWGVAVADVIATLIGAWLISRYTGWNLLYTTIGVFIVGVVLHRVFCVKTTFAKLIRF